MAEGKNKVIVYRDWINIFESLSDDEAGRLIKHLFRYVNDMNPTAPDRITELAFVSIKSSLKRDLESWKKTCEVNRANGKNGGRPRNLTKPTETEKTEPVILQPKKADKDNDSEKDNEIDTKKTKKHSAILFSESKYHNNPTLFKTDFGDKYQHIDLDYYFDAVSDWSASNGQKKVDWIATARNFIRKDGNGVRKLTQQRQTSQAGAYD